MMGMTAETVGAKDPQPNGSAVTVTRAKQEPSPDVHMGRVRWTICAMLFGATSINYMDRQVIAILKPTLEHSIGLTEVSYSYIVDSFQIAYTIGLLAAGRFIDKVGTRVGYMVVMALWGLSAMGHALANTALEFGVARFCLGIGESGNFPAAIKTVAEWFPQRERSLATGIFNSGSNVGAILAPVMVPWVTLRYGWHAAFLITGGFSAMWILWWFSNYRKPADHPRLTSAELSHINQYDSQETGHSMRWVKLLGERQTWAYSSAKFLTDPIWWFYLYWLPSYFSSRFHLSLSQLGFPLIIVYNAAVVGSIGGGWLPEPFLRLGVSSSNARLAAMFLCACMTVPIFTVTSVRSEGAAIALFSLAASAHCGWAANVFTTASDMFPRSAVGSVTGIGSMAGAAGGFILATFAGYNLESTHSYSSLFVIAASAYLLALLVMILLAPGLRRVEVAM
jgi:ACS family hexuronate transporter-like MFS transporter